MARGADTRAKILAAATRLAAAHGLHAAAVQTVAREAGVPKSVVLYHFDTATGLREATVRHAATTLRAAFDGLLRSEGGGDEGDPKQRLGAWVAARCGGHDQLAATSVWLQALALGPPVPAAQVCIERRQRALADILRDGHVLGAWRAADAHHLAADAERFADGLALGGVAPADQRARMRQWLMDRLVR